MNPMRRFLVVSVVANVGLAGLLLWLRTPVPSPAAAGPGVHSPKQHEGNPDPAVAGVAGSAVDPESAWGLLRSDDLNQFAANLRAAGLTERFVRAVIAAEIDDRYRARELALAPPRRPLRYWEYDDTRESLETKLARLDLKREKARRLIDTLGPDPDAAGRSGGIPPEKRELARMIAEDYDTLIAEVTREDQSLLLPSEEQMLARLEGEKDRELEALLTRPELMEFIVESSALGTYLKRQLRGFAPTEAEFRAIFEAQNEFQAARKRLMMGFSVTDIGWTYQGAQLQMEDALRAALGDERYQSYQREKDPVLQNLRDLADRAGMSREAADRAFDLRAVVTRESKRIGDDTSQSVDARQAAIAELGRSIRAQLQSLLGAEAAQAYFHTNDNWLSALENGYVVELKDGGTAITSIGPRPVP